jgi:cytochrome d ubiquinol oxidase subunit I
MWVAAIAAPVQILIVDAHGLKTHEHQPIKVMAMEDHCQRHPNGAPLILFGIPYSAENRANYAVEIPKLSALIFKRDLNAPLAGLDTIAKADQPPVDIVFRSFRTMVGLNFLMALLSLLSLYGRWR